MYTNYVILDEERFTLLNNGIQITEDLMNLTLRFLLDDYTFEEVENCAKNTDDILNIYDTEDQIVGVFKGYTELYSIKKLVDYPVDAGNYADVIELQLNRPEEIWFYVAQIKKGKMTIDDVPDRLKEEVEKALEY